MGVSAEAHPPSLNHEELCSFKQVFRAAGCQGNELAVIEAWRICEWWAWMGDRNVLGMMWMWNFGVTKFCIDVMGLVMIKKGRFWFFLEGITVCWTGMECCDTFLLSWEQRRPILMMIGEWGTRRRETLTGWWEWQETNDSLVAKEKNDENQLAKFSLAGIQCCKRYFKTRSTCRSRNHGSLPSQICLKESQVETMEGSVLPPLSLK